MDWYDKELARNLLNTKLDFIHKKFKQFYSSVNKIFNNNIDNTELDISKEKSRIIINLRDRSVKNSIGINVDEYKSAGFIVFLKLFLFLEDNKNK
ncbi:hypothetical protein SCORR_v1c06710 [Spiroplasma corruscae]|uniref:Uncharacterized protein n=1 Tax=Spiroplasma corruscae TaxID=216934 RepID=A0A222EQC7_9MOLU|nr:hypothetical protein [Spiroplasma corruscae]ASP28443.1 hypothetical protein SCORR_v1c06710 [Spiroplasma corruscae]